MKGNTKKWSYWSAMVFYSIMFFSPFVVSAKGGNDFEFGLVPENVPFKYRTIETKVLDSEKRIAMKTILYVHDMEESGNPKIIGVETIVYEPISGRITHTSVAGVVPRKIDVNGAFIVISDGAKGMSFYGDNNIAAVGSRDIPKANSQ